MRFLIMVFLATSVLTDCFNYNGGCAVYGCKGGPTRG